MVMARKQDLEVSGGPARLTAPEGLKRIDAALKAALDSHDLMMLLAVEPDARRVVAVLGDAARAQRARIARWGADGGIEWADPSAPEDAGKAVPSAAGRGPVPMDLPLKVAVELALRTERALWATCMQVAVLATHEDVRVFASDLGRAHNRSVGMLTALAHQKRPGRARA